MEQHNISKILMEDSMKITILTSYFHPEITAATHLLSDLAYDFAKYGAKVTVVTNFPTRGVNKEVKEEYLNRKDETIKSNLRILRTGSTSSEGGNFIFRVFRYASNTFFLYRAAKKVDTDIYFVTSTPPFLGIVSSILSKNRITVYNLQDVFPDSLINAGKGKETNLFIRFLRKAERYIYSKQNHIITISRDFKNLLIERGVPKDKVTMIYNWIDENEVTPIKKEENKLFKKYGLDRDKYYVTYCGNIGYSQNLEMVIDAAAQLENELPNLRFVFIGDGAWKNNIEKYIRKKNVNNVKLIPFQPYKDISHVMSLGDISLVCSKPNVGTSSFPSKTWSIMAAGKPVLCSFDLESELCYIINKAQSGITVPPNEKEALKNAIRYSYLNKEETQKMGYKGRNYIENKLTRGYATKQYFDVLNKALVKSKENVK
jgi:glycosyltransferase involved in cell wall biosynthesis